jgi:ribokinase
VRIMNIGSLNLDFVYQVDNFVQPGETIASLDMKESCGGKGLNQSIAVAKAGQDVWHVGLIGEDGAFLIDQCKEYGVDTHLVKTVDSPTGHAIIQVDHVGQNCIILCQGANHRMDKRFINDSLSDCKTDDVLLLQNEINMVGDIIDIAFEKGMRIALNPSPINDAIREISFDKLTWLFLNEGEGTELTGETEPDRIADTLLRQYPQLKIILTLGKKGVLYADIEQREPFGIYYANVEDTTGAGDTFTGYFVAETVSGKSVRQALEIASKAASICVSRKGAAQSIPFYYEVEKESESLKRRYIEPKI